MKFVQPEKYWIWFLSNNGSSYFFTLSLPFFFFFSSNYDFTHLLGSHWEEEGLLTLNVSE